jgi:hypothetical protein
MEFAYNYWKLLISSISNWTHSILLKTTNDEYWWLFSGSDTKSCHGRERWLNCLHQLECKQSNLHPKKWSLAIFRPVSSRIVTEQIVTSTHHFQISLVFKLSKYVRFRIYFKLKLSVHVRSFFSYPKENVFSLIIERVQ